MNVTARDIDGERKVQVCVQLHKVGGNLSFRIVSCAYWWANCLFLANSCIVNLR